MFPLLIPNLFIRQIVGVFLIILVALIINSLLRRFIKIPRRLETRRGRTYVAILRNVITLGIVFFSLYIMFLVLNINLTPLLASAGLIGIVVGISAHSVLDDLIAGFFLISQSKIAIGDYINVESVEGTVVGIGLKSLTLKGEDGSIIIVPNGQIKNIINYTYVHGREHNVIDISVKMAQPIDTILDIFQQVLEEFEKANDHEIYKDSRVVGVKSFDGTNVTIRTLIIAPHGLREKIEIDFRYRIIKEFEKKKLAL